MRASFLAAIFVAAATASASAWAGYIGKNLYIAADVGQLSAPGFDGKGVTSPRLEIGIQPEQGWGVELSAITFGPSSCGGCSTGSGTGGAVQTGPNTLVSADAVQLFDTYTKPINSWISLTGKFGVAYTSYRADTASGYWVDNSTTNIGGGIGVQFNLFRKFRLRLQVEELRTAGYVTGMNRLRYVSAGWVLRFH